MFSETGTETKCRDHEEQYRRRILGDKPLSVIRGEGAFDGSGSARKKLGDRDDVDDGHGTTDERSDGSVHGDARREMLAAMKRMDEELKREQLKLSRNSRFRNVPGCGHDVNQARPDVVAEEIRWVLANVNYEEVAAMNSIASHRSRFDPIFWIRHVFRLH